MIVINQITEMAYFAHVNSRLVMKLVGIIEYLSWQTDETKIGMWL